MSTTEATATNGNAAPTIAIDRIAEERLRIPIIGTSPLIMNRFSAKAKQTMLDSAMGRKSPKQPKNPDEEYESCFYRLGEPGLHRFGFPADAFKQATVAAARFYGKEVTMTSLKQFLFFSGEIGDDGRQMVEIEGEARRRDDVVRVGRGGSDVRFRPEFWPWHAYLAVTYFTSSLTRNSVLSLVDAGGLAVGVGDWRPERDGTFGTYRIDPDKEVEVL